MAIVFALLFLLNVVCAVANYQAGGTMWPLNTGCAVLMAFMFFSAINRY